MSFLDPALLADETTNAEGALAGVADAIPGWEAAEHHIETTLAEAWGAALGTAIQVFRDEVANRYLGLGDVLGVQRVAAVEATATSTWTFPDPAPADIIGGTAVSVTAADGSPVDFAVAEDWPVVGNVALAVPLVAVEPGEFANGVDGEAFTNEMPVTSIVLDAPASGGADEEDEDTYAGRLTDRARRMRALPITPEDFAAFALDVPGVARAYALNRFDPAAPTADSPGDVTVFPVDTAGAALGTSAADALVAYFSETERVLGTEVHVSAPAYVAITIAVTVEAAEDVEPGAAASAVQAALLATRGAATWDLDDDAPSRWAPRPRRTFNRFDVAAAIDDLPEIRLVLDVTVNGGASVDLPAPLSLPSLAADRLTVTVV